MLKFHETEEIILYKYFLVKDYVYVHTKSKTRSLVIRSNSIL